MLRVEGNTYLLDPPPEVIAKGAEAVVAHCREVFMHDKQGRMRTIIRHVYGVLYQAMDYGLTDSALFEANVKVENDRGNDDWFALQMFHLWDDLLPQLQKIWRVKLERDSLEQSAKEEEDEDAITSFPFNEREVMWAFSNFFDAYGPVLRRQEAHFRRCACVDENGRRRPW